jgi:flagellar biosynthesis/type III secretory pathway chaperone
MHDITLLDLFTQDIDTAERLLELIDEEFTVLGERDLPRLQSILAEKLPLLTRLDQHAKARSQVLLGLKLSADRTGLQVVAPARLRLPACSAFCVAVKRQTSMTAAAAPLESASIARSAKPKTCQTGTRGHTAIMPVC